MPLISITDIVDGQDAVAASINSRFAQIVNVLNGNVDSANLSDNAVGTSKLANNAVTGGKISNYKVTFSDNGTGITNNNEVILRGWGYIQGNNSTTLIAPVTFPVTFSAVPTVVANCAGFKGSVPTAADGTLGNSLEYAHAQLPTTTGCSITVKSQGSNMGTGNYWVFSFIVIGQV